MLRKIAVVELGDGNEVVSRFVLCLVLRWLKINAVLISISTTTTVNSEHFWRSKMIVLEVSFDQLTHGIAH